MGTAALKYYDGRVYVPTSGLGEESAANGRSAYVCCSYRGSVTALDANTGKVRWWKSAGRWYFVSQRRKIPFAEAQN